MSGNPVHNQTPQMQNYASALLQMANANSVQSQMPMMRAPGQNQAQNREFSIEQEDFPSLSAAAEAPSSKTPVKRSAPNAQQAPSQPRPTTVKTSQSATNSAQGKQSEQLPRRPAQKTASRSAESTTSNSSQELVSDSRFGLMGLLGVIRMTDPDLNTLALGCDLTSLGLDLNQSSKLSRGFLGPWSEVCCDTVAAVQEESLYNGTGIDKADAGSDPQIGLKKSLLNPSEPYILNSEYLTECYSKIPKMPPVSGNSTPIEGMLTTSLVFLVETLCSSTKPDMPLSVSKSFENLKIICEQLLKRGWIYHKLLKIWFRWGNVVDEMNAKISQPVHGVPDFEFPKNTPESTSIITFIDPVNCELKAFDTAATLPLESGSFPKRSHQTSSSPLTALQRLFRATSVGSQLKRAQDKELTVIDGSNPNNQMSLGDGIEMANFDESHGKIPLLDVGSVFTGENMIIRTLSQLEMEF